jgi:hypothetical protein
MYGRHVAGRFAQARGSSSWARAFNANVSHKFTSPPMMQRRLLCAVPMNLAQCLGEVPLGGFAEQYRSITQSFATVGQAGSGSDSLDGDADAQVVAGGAADELEFVQIAEVPTLFTYCHQTQTNRHTIAISPMK